MSDETRRRLIIGGPLAFAGLVVFLAIRADRQSEAVAPSQSARATPQPAKREPTPFEVAEPSFAHQEECVEIRATTALSSSSTNLQRSRD